MKNKSTQKANTSFDRIIEAISDKKNAWKKIVQELEKEIVIPKNDKD